MSPCRPNLTAYKDNFDSLSCNEQVLVLDYQVIETTPTSHSSCYISSQPIMYSFIHKQTPLVFISRPQVFSCTVSYQTSILTYTTMGLSLCSLCKTANVEENCNAKEKQAEKVAEDTMKTKSQEDAALVVPHFPVSSRPGLL